MCGIFGLIKSNLDSIYFSNIVETLKHRGPDGKGHVYLDNSVFLGHTRLSIIDLTENAKQPMCTDNEKIWISYNGEIYNFRELRKDLEKQGYRFKSTSDTEVILNLYAKNRENCLEDLNGMFAFVIYDREKKKLFIARDRLGIKPLYYAFYNGNFVFASEIKTILATGLIPKEVAWQAIYDYFSFLNVPAPQTAFKNIVQLPPAHYLMFDLENSKMEIVNYWKPKLNSGKDVNESYDETKRKLLNLVNDSVKRQLISDVPLGVFLSGGIDSSVLTAVAAKNLGERIKTFTVVFEEDNAKLYDESIYAKEVSDFIGTEHYEIPVRLGEPEKLLDLINCFDQPFANPTFYLSYLISKETRKYVKVALSGAGGDELFGGYPRYTVLKFAKLLSLFPKEFSRLSLLANILPENENSHLPRRIKLFLRGLGERLPEQYLRWTYYLSDEDKKQFLGPLLNNEPLKKSTRIIEQYLSENTNELLNNIQYVDLKTFLPDNILEYTDKTSMACGLEVRVPFLDHRIVELSYNMPAKYKIRNNISKYILKDAFKDLLPQKILTSPKRGFCPPLSFWIENNFNFYFEKILTKEYIRKQGIINWDYIQMLRKQHVLKQHDNSMELFGIIMFDVWFKKYFL